MVSMHLIFGFCGDTIFQFNSVYFLIQFSSVQLPTGARPTHYPFVVFQLQNHTKNF